MHRVVGIVLLFLTLSSTPALAADRPDRGIVDLSVMGVTAPIGHPYFFGVAVLLGVRLHRPDPCDEGGLYLDLRNDLGRNHKVLAGVRIQGSVGDTMPYFVVRGGVFTDYQSWGTPYATVGGGFMAPGNGPAAFRLEFTGSAFPGMFYRTIPLDLLLGAAFRF